MTKKPHKQEASLSASLTEGSLRLMIANSWTWVTPMLMGNAVSNSMIVSSMTKSNAGTPSMRVSHMHLCKSIKIALTRRSRNLASLSNSTGSQLNILMRKITTTMPMISTASSQQRLRRRAARRISSLASSNSSPSSHRRSRRRVRITITTITT